MNIYLLKNDIVEVKYTSLKNLPPKQSLVVEPVSSYLKIFSLSEKGNEIIITTTKLKVIINRTSQAITYADLQNKIILAETETNNKVMRHTAVAGIKTYSCTTSFDHRKMRRCLAWAVILWIRFLLIIKTRPGYGN